MGSVLAEEVAAKDCKFTTETFEMTLPCEWKLPAADGEVDPHVVQVNENGARLSIYFAEEQASLRRISRKMRRTARVERWKLRKKRRTRIDGNRALVTLVDIKKQGLKTRQLFYFFNTDNGRYILHFGAHKKAFDYRLFRKVAASFKLRTHTAQLQ